MKTTFSYDAGPKNAFFSLEVPLLRTAVQENIILPGFLLKAIRDLRNPPLCPGSLVLKNDPPFSLGSEVSKRDPPFSLGSEVSKRDPPVERQEDCEKNGRTD